MGEILSRSQNPTRLPELQPWIARVQLRRIAVAEVDEEIRADMAFGEELLVASVGRNSSFASGERMNTKRAGFVQNRGSTYL